MNYCTIGDCPKRVHGRKMCSTHYMRWRQTGNPDATKRDFHGMRDTPEYRSYAHMLGRCYTPTDAKYPIYGGRGITVCDRWRGREGFRSFYADMGARPSPKMSLDRIDVDGNYEPNNCRWATRNQQSLNRRSRSKTPYIVDTCKGTMRWRVIIKRDKKYLMRQTFPSQLAAEIARDRVLADHNMSLEN